VKTKEGNCMGKSLPTAGKKADKSLQI